MPPSKPATRPHKPAAVRSGSLARTLAAEILDGKRPVGALLPGEADLAAQHGISLSAVRAALRQLESLGLAVRSRGGAARVVSGEVRATYLIATGELEQARSDYAGATKLTIERQRQVTADAELAVLLGVPEGSRWLHLTGLRQPLDEAPVLRQQPRVMHTDAGWPATRPACRPRPRSRAPTSRR